MTYTVLCGDVSEVLPTLAPESFDAVLCDPPYGLSFMGKAWDHGVPSREVWEAVARTLKPGAHLLAFGGTRTFHRLAVAIEDAGFEVRDCLSWLYGSGFPKSLDISKAIDKAAGAEREVVGTKFGQPGYSLTDGRPGGVAMEGSVDGSLRNGAAECAITAPATPAARQWQGYGSALKPAWEPCIVAMKPTDGTFAENALRHGVAGLNVDGGRIGSGPRPTDDGQRGRRPRGMGEPGERKGDPRPNGPMYQDGEGGRWPANLILDEGAARLLDEMSGERKSPRPYRFSGKASGGYGGNIGNGIGHEREYGDTGGASRFFYCAKSSRREREAGLSDAGIERNHHPTLKPLALCEYLARLILPPKRDTPRRLLVPFSGSGSEMIGALLAGWDEVVGIEREAEYVAIAEARLAHWTKGKAEESDGGQMELIA